MRSGSGMGASYSLILQCHCVRHCHCEKRSDEAISREGRTIVRALLEEIAASSLRPSQ
jgi:hypothetical protein